MKALITNKLLRHAKMDVKVSVLSCIIEITRITAPNAPYKDEQMEEIFQLILATFENVSCVMLDLECDALIVEMSRSFLKIIRSNHPLVVFSAIETIMNLVIDESEDIFLDLFSSLFAIVKKEN